MERKEELEFLVEGARKRVGSEAWGAHLECEKIAKDGCRDAEKRIAAARTHLDRVEAYLNSLRNYQAEGKANP
jgi:hypothetical protein